MSIIEIQKAASEFRSAIESCSDRLGVSFEHFPRGSCGDASDLLGTYLIEKGLGSFNYYCGDFGCKSDNTWSSHAWLQSGTLIVDITADQFPDITDKVIVTNDSAWHKSLNGKNSHVADYRHINAPFINLAAIYKEITECVNAI